MDLTAESINQLHRGTWAGELGLLDLDAAHGDRVDREVADLERGAGSGIAVECDHRGAVLRGDVDHQIGRHDVAREVRLRGEVERVVSTCREAEQPPKPHAVTLLRRYGGEMSESGRSCRRSDRRAPAEIEVSVVGEEVIVERRGRRVTLRGAVADEVRRALEVGDDATVQRAVAKSLS